LRSSQVWEGRLVTFAKYMGSRRISQKPWAACEIRETQGGQGANKESKGVLMCEVRKVETLSEFRNFKGPNV
jgi:hypothetical protein